MIFLTPAQVASTNRYVAQQPAERNPKFPRTSFAGALLISGGVLRYSTTSASPNEAVLTRLTGTGMTSARFLERGAQ